MLKSGKGRGWRGLNTGSYTAPTPVAPTITSVTLDNTAPIVGQTVTATPNGVTGYPTPSASYQWKRGATNVGTDNAIYTAVSADIGSTLTCTVTLTNGSGSASATSSATSAVVASGSSGTAPPAPSFTASAGAGTSLTINYSVVLTSPQSGDIEEIEVDTDPAFGSVLTTSDNVDAGDITASQADGTLSVPAAGTYYLRARTNRGGTYGDYSSPIRTVTVVGSGVPATFALSPSSVLDNAASGTTVGTVTGSGSDTDPHKTTYALSPSSVLDNAASGTTVGTVS